MLCVLLMRFRHCLTRGGLDTVPLGGSGIHRRLICRVRSGCANPAGRLEQVSTDTQRGKFDLLALIDSLSYPPDPQSPRRSSPSRPNSD